MPIYGDSLREAARLCAHRLNSLLGRTPTFTPIQSQITFDIVDGVRTEIAILRFPRRPDGSNTIELDTIYGPMDLYLGQACDGIEDIARGQLRLRTIGYVYTIQPHAWDDRLLRWEYVRFPSSDAFWNRHHIQGPLGFEILDDRGTIHALTLNQWHVPTGPVRIEDVIRFCLHDLGATALAPREDWDRALRDSQEGDEM